MLLKDHFELSNIFLHNHERYEDFLSSRFGAASPPTVAYTVWRIFWAIYHSIWLVAGPALEATNALKSSSSFQEEDVNYRVNGTICGIVQLNKTTLLSNDIPPNKTCNIMVESGTATAKWFIYLSHWVYLLLTVACVMDAVLVARALRSKERKRTFPSDIKLPCSMRVVWLLSTVSYTSSIMICLWYWTYLHKGKELTAQRLNTHAIASLYCVLDLMVSTKPFRLLHGLYVVLFGVAYTAFSAIYQISGGTDKNGTPTIYPMLDWFHPLKTLVISSSSNFVGIPIVHIFMWLIALGSQAITRRLKDKGSVDGELVQDEDVNGRLNEYDQVDEEKQNCKYY